MDVVLLSRIQFALTAGFHYIFPTLTIGLSILLVIMEGAYLRTKNPLYKLMTEFWVRVFALIFAIGVATGIVLEFEFGTNWATYSRYVGDIFGSALAAEGIFAFFLESGFLAILLFGWNRVRPGVHYFATIMVAFGAHFSAVWIIVANSWMQTPVGYHIVGEGTKARAEITDFWAMVFNPSAMDRLTHSILGAWQAGAFLVISIGAYYLLKNRHQKFALSSIRFALILAVIASLGQLVTGHSSAVGVSNNQPEKLATLEGHFEADAPADMYLIGWVNEDTEEVTGLKIPGLLSLMLSGNNDTKVPGLRSFSRMDWPPVNIVFQAYHFMVGIGLFLIALSIITSHKYWRGSLSKSRKWLLLLVFSVLAPQFANQLGWITAEVGRQPWIVYKLLRTNQGVSVSVQSELVLTSLILFTLI
ncbi:cytochrome ubiquinol oxidase subunit I, partial [Candidatus Neomarinimicrobiota bacterium]